MAKKIRFPLEMAEGVQVRTIEELRENFDLEKILGYFIDGKLQIWLSDRYYEYEAISISQLQSSDINLNKKLCEILGINYSASEEVDIKEIEKRKARVDKLKQFTDDEGILNNIDCVAFNQEELAYLLDNDIKTIFLCEGNYMIPISKENVTYIGINMPIVNLRISSVSVLEEKNIVFKKVIIKNNGETVLEDSIRKKNLQIFIKKRYIFDPNIEYSYENEDGNMYNITINSIFVKDTYSGEEIMISDERESAEDYICYNTKIFYTVGKWENKDIFVRDINQNTKRKIKEWKGVFDKFLYVDEDHVFWRDMNSMYYMASNDKDETKNIYNPVNHGRSLIEYEIFTNEFFFFIDKDDELYRRDLITDELQCVFKNVRLAQIYNGYLYIEKQGKNRLYNFYKIDLKELTSEFISSTKEMYGGRVLAFSFHNNKMVWINSGLYAFKLYVLDLDQKKAIELDKWKGNSCGDRMSVNLDDEWIYYTNKERHIEYLVNRKIRYDGSDKHEVKEK